MEDEDGGALDLVNFPAAAEDRISGLSLGRAAREAAEQGDARDQM